MHAPDRIDALSRHALREEAALRVGGQRVERGLEFGQCRVAQYRFDRALAHRRLFREAHAIRRQDTCQRMRQHLRHAQRIGHAACMLAARAAERRQYIVRDIVAALYRDLLDRIGHAADRDLQEALGQGFGGLALAGRRGDLVGQRGELAHHGVAVERLVRLRSEHLREVFGLDLA